MDYNAISNTLQNFTNKRPKQREIAEILGLRVNVIGQRASRKSNFSAEELKKIGDYYGVNLIEGTPMCQLETVQSDDSGTVEIDYYPDVFGSCGGGAFVLSETTEKMQVPINIIEGFRKLKKYSIINAIGDSMQPYIHDRDLLVVEHYDGEQIRDNRIYVFRIGDNIFIKRLVLNINQLVIKSDNVQYQPIVMCKQEINEVQIIGQIVGLMRGTR